MALEQFPFYLLSLEQQRLFLLILNHAQNGKQATMGPFAVLNYEAATDVSSLENMLINQHIKFILILNDNSFAFYVTCFNNISLSISAYQYDWFLCHDDAKCN